MSESVQNDPTRVEIGGFTLSIKTSKLIGSTLVSNQPIKGDFPFNDHWTDEKGNEHVRTDIMQGRY